MKTIILENHLIINTFDLSLKGKAIFGKILKIDLTKRITMELENEIIIFEDKPECEILGNTQWDILVLSIDCEIFDLNSNPIYFSLFQEVSIAMEKYYANISNYVGLYNKFPYTETTVLENSNA